MSDSSIRVAILGGGIAGAVLMRALLKQTAFRVDIFESRPEFKEEGAGVGLQKNALDSLEAIDPQLLKDLQNAGAVLEHFRMAIGVGPQAGTELQLGGADQAGDGKVGSATFYTVGRHAFLQQILATVPADRMHANKRLTDLVQRGDEYELHFSDGTVANYDVVIGADGVRGRMRSFVVGADHPSLAPQYAGWWFMITIAPIEKVKEALGPQIVNTTTPTQWCLIGEKGQFMLHDYVHSLTAMNVAINIPASSDGEKESWAPIRDISRQEVLQTYSNWPEHYGQKYVNVVCDHSPDPPKCYAMSEHRPGAPYAKDSLAIVGDAAHAMAPWQGSGAGVSIEDALVLSSLLGQTTSKAEIPAAFRAYDAVRRPRTEAIVKSSNEAGKLMTGLTPGVGLNKHELEKALGPKWNHILAFDAKQHVQEALEQFAKQRAA